MYSSSEASVLPRRNAIRTRGAIGVLGAWMWSISVLIWGAEVHECEKLRAEALGFLFTVNTQ